MEVTTSITNSLTSQTVAPTLYLTHSVNEVVCGDFSIAGGRAQLTRQDNIVCGGKLVLGSFALHTACADKCYFIESIQCSGAVDVVVRRSEWFHHVRAGTVAPV